LISKAEQLKVKDSGFISELAQKHRNSWILYDFIDEVTTELDIAKHNLFHEEQIKSKKLRSCFITFNHADTAQFILKKFEEDKINRIIAFDKEEFR
jgi:hypothetical protein